MKKVLHPSNTRGHANHGWLKSYHTFSFANYHDPKRMHFGALRVLNDDTVAPGKGFGTHPHRDMEIISIPLEGDLAHKDNMGNTSVIKQGDVQVMSAGTGILHSEYNNSKTKEVKFLQIWIVPREKNVAPRYGQFRAKDTLKKNTLQQIVSPNKEEEGVWIHQDAWFYLADFDRVITDRYRLRKKGNGVYLFLLEGRLEIANQSLEKRDGIGVWDTDEFFIKTTADTKFLLMEVPM